jgi:EF hand
MIVSKTFIPALILLFGAGWAMAEEGMTEEGEQRLPNFNQVDADRNGVISPGEASQVPGLVEAFAQVDLNTDGWLDQDEYSALEQASGR